MIGVRRMGVDDAALVLHYARGARLGQAQEKDYKKAVKPLDDEAAS